MISALFISSQNMKLKEYIKRKENLRFLILRMKPVGDTILTTPLIYALRSKFPDSRICVVVFKEYADLISNNPFCDEILVYDKKKPLAFLIKMLSRKFDVSIDIMNNPRTSQINLFAWPKYRIGLPRVRNFFYNIKITSFYFFISAKTIPEHWNLAEIGFIFREDTANILYQAIILG